MITPWGRKITFYDFVKVAGKDYIIVSRDGENKVLIVISPSGVGIKKLWNVIKRVLKKEFLSDIELQPPLLVYERAMEQVAKTLKNQMLGFSSHDKWIEEMKK